MCDSTYTIDFRTGEKLHCSGEHLQSNPFVPERNWKHSAEYSGVIWTWFPKEEDKHD